MYKNRFGLNKNNLQWLICPKTRPNQTLENPDHLGHERQPATEAEI